MSDDDLLAVLPRIAQLSTAMNRGRMAQRAMDATGLSLDRPGLTILVTLVTEGTPLRVGEIADRMQVVGPHVTRQVQALEQRGLVQRVADPHDKRVSLIEPTPTGTEAAQRYMTTVLGWFRDVINDWPAQDRADLGRLLTKLADDLTTKLTEP
ncbi:MarR family winged helix-turn-helix transcriptional regulator [Kribbella sp. NPDC056345]|uniref:MarR family winged helix-turn-helix transcriptional regulator n=1 Tax=Kribbella sp. NPDC056345 TaxID=3345789 RepID=UPI0035DF1D5A